MLAYFLIRILTFPLSLLPYRALHAMGKPLGTLAYHLIPKFRKRALANLTLASDLELSPSDVQATAKKTLQGLMITCLEYPKLAREKNISRIATCVNPEIASELMKDGKGVIFFCGHQANWELLFLEGTARMQGVAIGRPIKNARLYRWVLAMRQKFGGKIVPPKEAIKEGLRALKNGAFFGIVGDQGMPGSGYSSNFLGRLAWTSPVPALLAYKTNCPIIVATTKRENGHYFIHYSDPIFPNSQNPKEKEVKQLMDKTLALYADSIRERPHEWLWIHNRWKQQTRDALKSPYRHDSIGILLSDDKPLLEMLPLLRKIYPTESLTLFCPPHLKPPIDAEVIPYTSPADLYKAAFRSQLLFNLTGDPTLERPFRKGAAQKILDLEALQELITRA